MQTTETVTVENPVESVSLDTGSGGLEFGDRETTDYEVTATFASGRTVDVTDEASVTSNAGVVTVDETANTLQAVEAGEATLTATYNEVSDETSLGVTDPLADINLTVPTPLEVSETAGYEVNATFESGRTEDITDEASVTSDDRSVVTVDEQAAEIEAIGEGIATLTAGYQSVENSSEVSVTDETEGGLPKYLENLATDSGGPVVTFPDRDPIAIQEGDSFGELGADGDSVVTWVTNGDDIEVTSETPGITTIFGPAKSDSGFEEIGDTGFYERAPTGFGTPQPDQGDYELVNIEEDDDGYLTEWQEVSDGIAGLGPTEEIPVSSNKDSPNRSQYDALEEIELPDPFTLVLEVEQNGEPFTG